MIDVNIIADGNMAKLIALECERMGLKHQISHAPIPDTKLYICDLGFVGANSLPCEKTIVIGNTNDTNFCHSLGSPFLLSEFRKLLVEMLTDSTPTKTEAPRRQKKTLTIVLNDKSQTAKIRGNEIKLSSTEFKILDLLLSRKGEVVTCEEIDTLINNQNSNKTNVYICFLRKKLEAQGDKIIYSIRGKGFTIK